ncbi:MAG: hypothetical protein PHX03_02645 [Bacilli bacterium]|nr:hypothetical protein [Bacilli bacterium]
MKDQNNVISEFVDLGLTKEQLIKLINSKIANIMISHEQMKEVEVL